LKKSLESLRSHRFYFQDSSDEIFILFEGQSSEAFGLLFKALKAIWEFHEWKKLVSWSGSVGDFSLTKEGGSGFLTED
jgi:hypothetical protein